MNGPSAPRTAFLIGTEGALADRLRAAGVRVLGEVAHLDLFFPLSRQCGASLLVLGEAGADGRPLSEAVAQLRVVCPHAEIAVLTHGADTDLEDAGATRVLPPPHEPEAVAAALVGEREPELLGAGSAWVWKADDPPAGAGEPLSRGGVLALRRERAWRQREAAAGGQAPCRPPFPTADGGPLLRQQVVAFLGSRGGVGRTFLAAHAAAVLALASRARTLLADLSPAGDAALYLDLPEGPSLIDLLPHLGPAAGEGIGRFVRVHRDSGLHVLAGVPRPDLDELVTPDHVEALISRAREAYDFVILDAPARLPDERLLACARRATSLLLVSTAEPTAIRQGRLLLDWLGHRHVPLEGRVHLVLNRLAPDGSLSLTDVARLIGLPPAATVPEDRRAAERAVFGRWLAAGHPEQPLAEAVWRVVALFCPLRPGGPEEGRPADPLRRLLSLLARVRQR